MAAPGGSARDQKRTLVLPRFWPRGYTEIGSRGNVFGTIFGFIFRTQNWSRFSGSLKRTFLKSKKRPHFQVQKTDLKMVPKIVRGFLVFGFDGVRFSTAGGVRFWGLGMASTGAPAEAQRAGREAISGGNCGGDNGVLAGPARGIFLKICSHMCRVARILIAVQASSCLRRTYSHNHDFGTIFP